MKPHSQELQDRIIKIMTWTVRAEEATTRKQALKALRKVAKHSMKLAQLQGRSYTEEVNQTED